VHLHSIQAIFANIFTI